MAMEEVGTTGSHGQHKVYQDKDAPKETGYWGMTRTPGEQPDIKTIQFVLDKTLDRMKQQPEDKQYGRDETIGFLTMLRELTEPAPSGFFYCPYPPLNQEPVAIDPASFDPRSVMSRYGKKLMEQGQVEERQTRQS